MPYEITIQKFSRYHIGSHGEEYHHMKCQDDVITFTEIYENIPIWVQCSLKYQNKDVLLKYSREIWGSVMHDKYINTYFEREVGIVIKQGCRRNPDCPFSPHLFESLKIVKINKCE